MNVTLPRGLSIAFVLYSTLTIALFRGLVLHIGSVLPHDLGDPVLSTWVLWWNAHRVPFTASWWDGLFFFPMHGALALSDHRVGLGVIASPVQWLGGSPVLAHNATLLLTFPLSATAAHALAWRLTRSYSASFIAGLVFGFNPYRTAHLQHLELLASFWLPAALVAMHEYVTSGGRPWLAVIAVALAMQGLSSGYYLLYGAPLLAGWIVWFVRDRRRAAAIVLACAAAAIVLSPVLLKYRDIQNDLGLVRRFEEIEFFGADVSAIASASPLLALWHTADALRRPEGELFPGAVAIALLILGILRPGSRTQPVSRTLTWARMALVVVAAAFALGAARAALAPGTFRVLGLPVSNMRSDRPLAVAALALALVIATSARCRAAFARRSVFAFYAVATVVLWLLALGPTPKLLGRPLLPRGPYYYLMQLPAYSDRLRVPSRFAMIAILSLAIAAAIAVARITERLPRRRAAWLAGCLCVGVVAESWVTGLALPVAPVLRPLGVDARAVASVIELPLGGDERDIGAVYQSAGHGRPVVNGYSGYVPHHYHVLQFALDRSDDTVFDALAARGPLLVRIELAEEPTRVASRLAARAGVARVAAPPGFAAFLIPAAPALPAPRGRRLPIRDVNVSAAANWIANLTDGDPETRWSAPERGDEEIRVELDRPHQVSGVSLMIGRYTDEFPRALAIATSLDGINWIETWRGKCGGLALRAVLDSESLATMTLPLSAVARFVRVRQVDRDDKYAWSVSEIAVLGE